MKYTGFEIVLVVAVSIFVLLLFACLVAAIGAGVLFLAWNAVVPEAFHGPHITFFQAFALMLMVSLLKGLVTGLVTTKVDSKE